MNRSFGHAVVVLGGLLPVLSAPAQDEIAFSRREVKIHDGSTELAGTLMQPRVDGPCSAVVVLGGAERGPRNALQARMAEALVTRGIAALVYDSPGTGGSTGNALLQTRAGRAAEAIAAVRFLRDQEGVHPDRVGVWGTSEGANVALLAAARCEAIAFAVAASGMFCLSPLEVARYRIEMQSRELSLDQMQKALLFEEILFAMVAGPETAEWPLLEAKAARWPDEPWSELIAVVRKTRSSMSRAEKEDLCALLGRCIDAFRSAPWFEAAVPHPEKFDRILTADADAVLTFLRVNPLAAGDLYASWQEYPEVAEIRCPLLAVWGENDSFVPPNRSAAALRACLGGSENRDVTIRILPGASHVFTTGGPDDPFVVGYPKLLVDWLRERFR